VHREKKRGSVQGWVVRTRSGGGHDLVAAGAGGDMHGQYKAEETCH
jgi:hypothetical protein